MSVLYDFGVSQEDVLSEYKALDIKPGDNLLCIASAGEIPLNMAALEELNIVAVDISINQLRLCRIKQFAATVMDSLQAAAFLGYMPMPPHQRQELYAQVISLLLTDDDRLFWDANANAIKQGVIKSARFEKYISKVAGVGRLVIGKKNFYRLFNCNTIEEQQLLFDTRISGILVKAIFKVAFHPRLYKNSGVDAVALTHSGTHNIADFFYNRFRNFCCNTLARNNYYLQYTFFNRVLYPEALPEYLQPRNHAAFVKNSTKIEYRLTDLETALQNAEQGEFNKIHLSNIGDWMSKEAMADLFSLISDKTSAEAKIVMRNIHLKPEIPASVSGLNLHYDLGRELVKTDRYPFYTIVPLTRQ